MHGLVNREFVRILATFLFLLLNLALLASPAGGTGPFEARPQARVAARAIVHGRIDWSRQLRSTSFEVFSRRTRSEGGGRSVLLPTPALGSPESILGFDALDDIGAAPADTTGALGDSFFVAATNITTAVYDRTGAEVVVPTRLGTLHPKTRGHLVFDPKVVYDQYDDTFILVYLMVEDSPKLSRIVTVTIPDGSANDITTWCATSFPGDSVPDKQRVWADYPGLGYNADRVTIATNQFDFPTGSGDFRYAQIMSVPKSSLYDCTADDPVADVFGGSETLDPKGVRGFTLQPAQTVNAPAKAQFAVSAVVWGKGSYLVVWHIKERAKGLLLKRGVIPIGRAGPPPFGTQAGGEIDDVDTWWDAGDDRLTSAFYDAASNQLFTAHAAAKNLKPDATPGGYVEAVVVWWELAPATALDNTMVARTGRIGAPEVDAGWPSLATDGSGTLFVTYSRASAVAEEFLSAWVAEIPPGATAATQALLTPGVATYDGKPGPERWGDYTAINRDPTNPAVMAVFNQYALDTTHWQQVVHLVQHV